MKLLIAGSRNITNIDIVLHALDMSGIDVDEVTEIVSGGALGVDSLAEDIAHDFDITFKLFKAEWDKYGKRAGSMRNKRMGRYADVLVAVWDGESKGTKDMIDFMNELGKITHIKIVRD